MSIHVLDIIVSFLSIFIFLVTTACAVGTSAAASTLALSVVLSCRNIHHHRRDEVLLGLDDVNSVAASLLHTVGLVSAVAVSAGARHGGLEMN